MNGRSKLDIANDLLDILSQTLRYYRHMKMIINNCSIRFNTNDTETSSHSNDTTSSNVVTLEHFPFRPMDMILPDNNAQPNGFAYILFSLKNKSSIYIASTTNIAKRVNAHKNAGPGHSS